MCLQKPNFLTILSHSNIDPLAFSSCLRFAIAQTIKKTLIKELSIFHCVNVTQCLYSSCYFLSSRY